MKANYFTLSLEKKVANNRDLDSEVFLLEKFHGKVTLRDLWLLFLLICFLCRSLVYRTRLKVLLLCIRILLPVVCFLIAGLSEKLTCICWILRWRRTAQIVKKRELLRLFVGSILWKGKRGCAKRLCRKLTGFHLCSLSLLWMRILFWGSVLHPKGTSFTRSWKFTIHLVSF